jgi:RNA polymerase sigma factor (TIGR02999 family)
MLQAWSGGDASALERLTPAVYAELHGIARRNLAGEREGHLLQPSALVNEAFLRLMGDAPVEWESRTQFFAFSARLMRQILIDFARAQETAKRGRRSPHVDLSLAEHIPAGQSDPVNFLDLDQALDELAQLDARQAQLVELRYFGGLDNLEIASVLGVSEPTVVRDWRVARAWLYDRLQPVRPGALGPPA